MQHISQTILKENKELVNLILPKTLNNYCNFRNLVKCPFQGKPVKIMADFNIDLIKMETSNYNPECF